MKDSDVKTHKVTSSDDCTYKTHYLLGPGLHASTTISKSCDCHMSKMIFGSGFYWVGEAIVYFVSGCVISFNHASCYYWRHSSSLYFGHSSSHILNNSTVHSSYDFFLKYTCHYSSHIYSHSDMYSYRYCVRQSYTFISYK